MGRQGAGFQGCGHGRDTNQVTVYRKKGEGNMKESTKQLAEGFACNYTVFEQGTDARFVEQAYRKAFEAGKEAGFYPAIVVANEYVADWLKEMDHENYGRDSIIASCKEDGKSILDKRLAGYMEDFGIRLLDDWIGRETDGDPISNFTGYCPVCGGMLEEDVLLLEVLVHNPWEMIGYFPMGGWNDCPGPEEMIAICKYWYEKYKAVPAVFTHDVMEFYAPEGLNGVDPIEAAKEHYAFCTDRVYQGTRTGKLSELAAGLEGSQVWYFWWD